MLAAGKIPRYWTCCQGLIAASATKTTERNLEITSAA